MGNNMVLLRNESAFTLIEVLIAIVILSFGLIAVASMQVVAIQINSSASKITRASTLVQDKIEALLALPYTHADLSDSEDVGVCESHTEASPPEGYSLTWCVDQDASNSSKTIDVTATWTSSGQQKSFSLSVVRTIYM